MLNMPVLTELDVSRDMISTFGGLNRGARIGDHEFAYTHNTSADAFPLLSERKRRGRVRALSKPNGMIAHEKLCWVDGAEFWYGGAKVEGLTLTDSPKTLIVMGARILIWPDAAYYNTQDGTSGTLGNKTVTANVSAALCAYDGGAIDYVESDTAPDLPKNGDYWLDTSGDAHILRQYSSTNGRWVSVPTVYTKISGAGLGKGFARDDGVTISGASDNALNGDFILYETGDDFVVVVALVEKSLTQAAALTIERVIPQMDFLTVSENRLWGCSSAAHEIYASKLGDPTNFRAYRGDVGDSYAVTVGSKGDFTGAVTHMGYPMFFKEQEIIKIYGTRPANYQTVTTNARGVEAGSAASIAIVNETLLYKSVEDICSYGTALPTSISAPLGIERYKNAVGGAVGRKYYVSMQDGRSEWGIYAFDTDKGIWHREDDTRALYMAAYADDLYYIDARDNCIYTAGGSVDWLVADAVSEAAGAVEWAVETGPIGLDLPDHKYISKVQVRAKVRGEFRLSVSYDGGAWQEKMHVSHTELNSVAVPIIPRRCDTFRIRMEGRGEFRLYSVTKTTEKGSEIR